MTSFKKKTDNTVFVRFVPPLLNRFQLEQHFSNIGPIKKCSVIRKNDGNGNDQDYNSSNHKTLGYGFVKFVSKQDAETAAKTQNNSTFVDENTGQSYKLFCELASSDTKNKEATTKSSDIVPKETQQINDASTSTTTSTNTQEQQDHLVLAKRKRYNRVIIRNLSFYSNEHHLRQVLENEFGPIVEVTIPKIGTTHRGFGFVTFEKPHHAQKAVDRSTPLLIKKRPVAIDFSTPKLLHQRMKKEQQQQDQQHKEDEKEEEENEPSGDDDNDNDNDSDSDSDSDASSTNSDDDDDDDDDDSDSDSTASDSEKDEDDESTTKQHVADDTPVSKGCTLFMRNLPFDATRHDVFTTFAKFGYITSAYLVKDRETGVAKGTAFVTFQKDASAKKALDAAGSMGSGDGGAFVAQKDNHGMGEGQGIYLSGRRLLVDMAVTKETAATLTAEKQETKHAGKDKRNLYLKMEGRVANLADNPSAADGQNSAWENLPESDQLKRQRAFAEKNTKLRSPLFFINPHRLSIRNLAKHVDESQLKKLLVSATLRGLEHNLVSQEDQVSHWRAGGEMPHREIMQRIKEAAAENKDQSVIPSFDEKNVKQFVPSLYIDRDFTTNKKEKAPSRGFGFVEFTHHTHALACLRELNNNPFYSEEYAAGGKKATDMKKNSKRKKRKSGGTDPKAGGGGEEFVGDDGRIRIPRLIVEFTVENKAKAKKQAEHKAQQQANIIKQKLEHKARRKAEKSDENAESKKSRGQKQRERKRKERDDGGKDSGVADTTDGARKASKKNVNAVEERKRVEVEEKKKVKSIKPPKKQRKVDKEEQDFEQMVRKYTAAFEGKTKTVESAVTKPVTKSSKKRWYD